MFGALLEDAVCRGDEHVGEEARFFRGDVGKPATHLGALGYSLLGVSLT